MDMLLDILEKYPAYKSFHLDSQTVPLQDYLEIRPEREAQVRKFIKEKRIFVGPWFCLPDEYSVSGESLIRNLLLGHKIARRFGHVSKTGYSPFGWGQISQMPQIYRGFGIPMTAFYRGINTIVAPRSEFIWEGPDGSRLVASRLAARPRYNVWYVLQRPLYWNQSDVGNRLMSWKAGSGPMKFIDEANYNLDAQYVHPQFNYHQEHAARRAQQAYDEQDGDWTTPHRFWSCGHDSSVPDMREIQMIEDCGNAIKDFADVFHSNWEDFQKGVVESASHDLPVRKGEMRHFFTKGSTSVLFGWIISARMDIKQDNFKTERSLMNYAEPMAVYASLLGSEYPQGFLNTAYNYLLQNHGHDSIGGCSKDIISEDMIFRTRQAREIGTCVMEQAMIDVVGSIDLASKKPEDVAIVVFNPTPFARTEVSGAVIDIPLEWKCGDFKIVDENDNKLRMQICETIKPSYHIVQSRNDTANMFAMSRNTVRIEFTDVPAMGYKTFFARPIVKSKYSQPMTMLTGPQTMENEYLSVTINSNGTLDIKDKTNNRSYNGLGYFRDSSEVGNPWEHHTVAQESVYMTLNERPQVMLIRDGELEAAFKIIFNWALPEGRTKDDKKRSEHLKPYTITNTVMLRRGQKWVEITTDVNNTVEDHYLQVAFPSGIEAQSTWAQGQFDVLERPIKLPDYTLFDEKVQTEQPMNSFIDITEGRNGFALLNEGLKAYEACDDPARTLSLTLLRCFPLRICVTQEMTDYSQSDKGSQCLGRHSFRYAVMPHAGDWRMAGLWQAAERFNNAFVAVETGPTPHGTEDMSKSFVELTPDILHVSAVKRNENGDGWIVRLFNQFDDGISGAIRFNGGKSGPGAVYSPVERLQAENGLPAGKGKPWSRVRVVSLEELPEKDIEMTSDGWVNFTIAAKKILTLEFLA
jgi:mannosylglycerate hydrolase